MADRASEISALRERLEPLIPRVRRPPPHWIVTPYGDIGSEWCETCGYYKVRNLRRHDRPNREDYVLDGGWRTEEDHPCFCKSCGVQLDVCLTTYAVDEEVAHFQEFGFSTNVGQDAFDLGELLDAVDYPSADDSLAERERRDAVIKLVAAFLAETGQQPPLGAIKGEVG